jgi:N-ethylmaleimide reductase
LALNIDLALNNQREQLLCGEPHNLEGQKMNTKLWQPIQIGDIKLNHRLAMAPMTRGRSAAHGVPTDLNAEYYAQRASMGLIISEGTQPSDDGQGYLFTPGIYTDDQVIGWRKVTEAVRNAGSQMFVQLMHVGRISHPANTPHGRQAVAPSAVKPNSKMFTLAGLQDIPEPRTLQADEIPAVIQEFRHAAATARKAGAEGVELHGASGYLIHQFLSDNANLRTDQYGGSVERKIRFAVEVASAVADEIGAGRTGIRISPGNTFNGIAENDVYSVYGALLHELRRLGLAYLHVAHMGDEVLLRKIRGIWPGVLILNRGGADLPTRIADIDNGTADVIAIASMSLANPDLVERIRTNAPLNSPDHSTFYGGGTKGYTDYPTLAMTAHQEGRGET